VAQEVDVGSQRFGFHQNAEKHCVGVCSIDLECRSSLVIPFLERLGPFRQQIFSTCSFLEALLQYLELGGATVVQ
jgi:hypothetical protein